MKLVYILGGNYDANGMSSIITKKINWYAENTDWEITAVLTESPNGRDFYYPLNLKVKTINFDLNYDELDTIPKFKKVFHYRKKQKLYKKALSDFLISYCPDIVISAMRREINFLTEINDGSKKVGELHFCKKTYRIFNYPHIPHFICSIVTKYWQNQLVKKIKKLDAFVVLTEEDKQDWGDLKNISVIPNFIGRIPEESSECNNKNVIAVGRYTWQKGFDLLLTAWKQIESQIEDWQLCIYGPGERNEYENLSNNLGLKRLKLYGTASDINDKFLSSSVFAFSSRYEGFGLVLIEAMSCGLPSVSFSCPCGPRDIITPNVDGFLIDNYDVRMLADKLLELMRNDQLRKKMGEKARENMSRFLEKKIMHTWVKLLKSL